MEPQKDLSDENAFIFVKPMPRKWVEPKGYAVPERKYDSKKYAKIREEIEQRGLEQQLRATVSSIESKQVVDRANLYFIVEADGQAGNRLYVALKALNATVNAYLDADHRIVLVSAPEEALVKYAELKLPLQIKAPILRVREIKPTEQMTKELEATEATRAVVVNVMPSVDTFVTAQHLDQVASYLAKKGCPILWSAQEGMIVTRMDKEKIYRVIEDSNLVFKIHALPLGIPSKSRSKPLAVSSSLATKAHTTGIDQLPIVCVVDSGLNEIPALAPYIIERSKGPGFADEGDGCGNGGHGTPIACLASLGEGEGPPRSRIISYKVYSDADDEKAFIGMMEALKQYSNRSKVFISSINLLEDAKPSYAQLDELIQRLNVCFVSSAGNIVDDLPTRISEYPSYISEYPVLAPADNAHVIGVGAIAKIADSTCVAPERGLSPFSRCGGRLPRLHDVKKPDLVENGGNLHRESLLPNGVGVSSFDRNGALTNSLAGTSFSAPLVARRLSEIIARYGHRVVFAEAYKALLFMSCEGRHQCCGWGFPLDHLESMPQQATFYSEGMIQLSDLTQKKRVTRFSDRITIAVPSGVRRIDMCLVHSDNVRSTSEPSLDTFLHVNARKTGRPSGVVQPDDKSVQSMKTYAKFFTWSFQKKDMEGRWTFEIIPETTRSISPYVRRNSFVRYGCVIIITSITLRQHSLSYYVRREAKILEGIEIE